MSRDRKQSKQFIDAARELGADEDPKSFDRALKELVKAPPPESVQERKKAQKKGQD